MNVLKIVSPALVLLAVSCLLCSCSSDEGEATVWIKNDFNNPEAPRQPPWTICKSSFRDVEFGKIELGQTSEKKQVKPGLGHVLMVAAWNDPSCAKENCLPIASKNEEEVVAGQEREVAVSMPNHQGPCPPEGVAPIPEKLYNEIRTLWPEYEFKDYAERTQNTECLPTDTPSSDGGLPDADPPDTDTPDVQGDAEPSDGEPEANPDV